MNILFIGDIFGSPGRRIVAQHLQEITSEEKILLAIANVENAAGGFGITPQLAEELFSLGIEVLTTGNHVWDKKEIYEYLPRQPRLLRPANYPCELPGSGLVVVRARNGVEVAVMNLQGRVHMPATDCPFHKADELVASLDPAVKVRFVDFHFIPFRPGRNLLPQGKVANEEQSSPFCIFAGIVEIWSAYHFAQTFMVLAKFRRVKVTLQKLRNDLIFRHAPNQPGGPTVFRQ